MLLDHELVF